MRISEANVGDAAAIAHLQVASWRDAFRGLLPDEYLDGAVDEDDRTADWEQMLRELGERESVLVTKDDGQIVAFAHFGPADEPGSGELYSMHVGPGLRGRGIGFDLHDAALRRLRAAGFRTVKLWLLEKNKLARRFYERQGWSEGDETREAVPPSGAIEVRYERPI